jgi:hypothetical protein
MASWISEDERCEEVRLADSHGRYGEHVPPGTGQLDVRQLCRRIEQDPQFHGHSLCAFGALEVMLRGRTCLAQKAAAAPRIRDGIHDPHAQGHTQ